MSILLSHLKAFDPKSSGQLNTNINATRVEGTLNTSEGTSEVLEFVKGEILKGQVIDLRSNLATIQLTDGRVIQGKLEQEVALYIGQTAMFEVNKSQENSIQLKYIQESPSNQLAQMVEKALEQAGLPINNRNEQMVNELLKANLSVDKNSLQKFLRILYQYPDSDMKSLIFLHKNQIPINETNLSMIKEYQNSEHRVIAQLSTLADGFVEALQGDCTDETAMKLFRFAVNSSTEIDSPTKMNEQMESSSTELTNANIPSENTYVQSVNSTAVLPKDLEGIEDFFRENKDVKLYAETLIRQIDQLLRETEVPGSKVEILRELFKNDSMKEVFKEELLRTHTLSPKQTEQKESVKRFYEQLEKELEEMTQILKNSSGKESGGKLASQTEHLKNNLDFMKTINQVYPYIQLPVTLKNQKLHSELFVYTNKKSSVGENETLSVLLRLDLQHLGELEIHVKMKQKNLYLKFYTQTDEAKSWLESTIQELDDIMLEKGYQVKSEFYRKQEDTALFEQMVAEEGTNTGVSMKRYTFDVRA